MNNKVKKSIEEDIERFKIKGTSFELDDLKEYSNFIRGNINSIIDMSEIMLDSEEYIDESYLIEARLYLNEELRFCTQRLKVVKTIEHVCKYGIKLCKKGKLLLALAVAIGALIIGVSGIYNSFGIYFTLTIGLIIAIFTSRERVNYDEMLNEYRYEEIINRKKIDMLECLENDITSTINICEYILSIKI